MSALFNPNSNGNKSNWKSKAEKKRNKKRALGPANQPNPPCVWAKSTTASAQASPHPSLVAARWTSTSAVNDEWAPVVSLPFPLHPYPFDRGWKRVAPRLGASAALPHLLARQEDEKGRRAGHDPQPPRQWSPGSRVSRDPIEGQRARERESSAELQFRLRPRQIRLP